MTVTFQNRRTFVPSVAPPSLLPGQVGFNLSDSVMFVGNGSDVNLSFDGSAVKTTPGQGWISLPLSFKGFGQYFVSNPALYGDVPSNGEVLTWDSAKGHPSWQVKGQGTVTLINSGRGLTGGPITSSGTLSLDNTTVTPGSYSIANITVDAQGRITAASNGSAVTSVNTGLGLTGGPITRTGTISLSSTGVVAGSYSNANITVDSLGRITSASNGSSAGGGTVTNISTGTGLSGGPITSTGTISLANTTVTPGSYTSANITVDAQGRITAASNGSGGGGGGGTVTSVATGAGLTGGPVTSTGVISIANQGIVDAMVSNTADIASSKLLFTPAPSGSVSRAVQEKLRDTVSIKDFGAVGDGVADDTAAFSAAIASGVAISIPSGTYLVSSNLTFLIPVAFNPGAVIRATSAITIAFNRNFQAGIYQIFDLSGGAVVTFNSRFTVVGYPEWWGALTNQGTAGITVTNLAAMSACVTACKVTQLQAADYFISGTLNITLSNRILRGVDSNFRNLGSVNSRLVVTNGTSDGIYIYTTPDPGTNIDNFIHNIRIQNLTVTRSLVPVPPASGNEYAGCAGIRLFKTLFATIDNVTVHENYIGYALGGTIRSNLVNCTALRTVAGSTTVNDKAFGFWLNGFVNIGLAGGNASTYLSHCNFSFNNGLTTLSDVIGFYFPGSFVDTFATACETSGGKIAMLVDGSGATTTGTADLHIQECICDTFTVAGLIIRNITNGYGSLDVTGNYFGAANPAPYGIWITNNTGGMINLSGNQVIGWPAAPANILGLYIENSSGISSINNMLLGCPRPVSLVNSSLCKTADIIRNPNQPVSQGAVFLSGSSRNYIQPNVSGGAGLFAFGINISDTTGLNTIDPTNVNPTCLTGGATARKLFIGGSPVTTQGNAANNNWVTGVML